MLLILEAMIMKKTDNTDKYLTKTSIDVEASASSSEDSTDATRPSNITPISKHPRHPSQQDRKLIEGVIRGDRSNAAMQSAIQTQPTSLS